MTLPSWSRSESCSALSLLGSRAALGSAGASPGFKSWGPCCVTRDPASDTEACLPRGVRAAPSVAAHHPPPGLGRNHVAGGGPSGWTCPRARVGPGESGGQVHGQGLSKPGRPEHEKHGRQAEGHRALVSKALKCGAWFFPRLGDTLTAGLSCSGKIPPPSEAWGSLQEGGCGFLHPSPRCETPATASHIAPCPGTLPPTRDRPRVARTSWTPVVPCGHAHGAPVHTAFLVPPCPLARRAAGPPSMPCN